MKDNKKRTLGICILLLYICSIHFAGCVELQCAYVNESVISEGWHQNTALRNSGTHFLGLEKWCSVTYEIKGNFPATLTISSLKTLVLSDKEAIEQQVRYTIEETFVDALRLEYNSSGKRTLDNSHQTLYVLYDGIDLATDNQIKIIGEVWNCATVGTSIICIGIAYVTNSNIPNVINTIHWEKIVSDRFGTISDIIGEDGLINNIKCH
ncbi:MAG: hypothetical protein R6V50_03460 [Thermoplasmatota archaeon]